MPSRTEPSRFRSAFTRSVPNEPDVEMDAIPALLKNHPETLQAASFNRRQVGSGRELLHIQQNVGRLNRIEDRLSEGVDVTQGAICARQQPIEVARGVERSRAWIVLSPDRVAALRPKLDPDRHSHIMPVPVPTDGPEWASTSRSDRRIGPRRRRDWRRGGGQALPVAVLGLEGTYVRG